MGEMIIWRFLYWAAVVLYVLAILIGVVSVIGILIAVIRRIGKGGRG